MPFKLLFTSGSRDQLKELEQADARKLKKVRNCLGKLENNPRHPGLQTHEYDELSALYGCKVFEAYVENNTPGAYRVFWHYGPQRDEITVVAITPHP